MTKRLCTFGVLICILFLSSCCFSSNSEQQRIEEIKSSYENANGFSCAVTLRCQEDDKPSFVFDVDYDGNNGEIVFSEPDSIKDYSLIINDNEVIHLYEGKKYDALKSTNEPQNLGAFFPQVLLKTVKEGDGNIDDEEVSFSFESKERECILYMDNTQTVPQRLVVLQNGHSWEYEITEFNFKD